MFWQNGTKEWYLYSILNKFKAMVQPQMRIWYGSTILKSLLIRVDIQKTFHKTAVLVTFSGKCDKNLSQKVIL